MLRDKLEYYPIVGIVLPVFRKNSKTILLE